MYENEYERNNQEQNPYVVPPVTGYGEYRGYGAGSDMINTPPRRKSSGKVITACIALTMAGLLVGTGVTYAYLNARGPISRFVDKFTEETTEASQAEEKEHVELTKSDSDKSDLFDSKLPTTASSGQMDVAEIVEKCLPSVVAITNHSVTEFRDWFGHIYEQDSSGAGSGVIIGQTDQELLILTNYHVIEDNQSLSVVFSWEEDAEDIDKDDVIYAKVKDYDADRDIAVISIAAEDLSDEILSKISVATVGSSDDLKLGEQVVAIGNALGYGQSVTTGIVSALNRKITSEYDQDDNAYIQTDAAINLGNSGGALFNMKGELVGINTAMMRSDVAENMGLAIPISEVTGEVESMMNQEARDTLTEDERGYLGINIVDVTEEISKTYGLPEGVYIANVASGSGAERAGLEKENIITGINGKSITTSEELTDYLSKYKKGETVTVTVEYRSDDGYATKDVEVTLGDSPD